MADRCPYCGFLQCPVKTEKVSENYVEWLIISNQKHLKSLDWLPFLLYLPFLAACEKSEKPLVNEVEGTYVGTITTMNGLKVQGIGKTIGDTIAEIAKTWKRRIEVHFYNMELDTTLMSDYYQHKDIEEVCFTGDCFENVCPYLGRGTYWRRMMNNMRNDEPRARLHKVN